MFFLHCHIAIFLPFNAAVQLATWATASSPTSQLLFLPCSISSYYMATPACFAWQLLTRQNGNSYSTYMATTSFSICLCTHPYLVLKWHSWHITHFLHFLRCLPWQTAACYAWQLLTGPHGNSYSTYMATIICSSNNVRVFFSG